MPALSYVTDRLLLHCNWLVPKAAFGYVFTTTYALNRHTQHTEVTGVKIMAIHEKCLFVLQSSFCYC